MSADPEFDLPPPTLDDVAWMQGPPDVPLTALQAGPPFKLPTAAAASSGSATPLPTAWTHSPAKQSGLARSFHRLNQWLGTIVERFTLPEDEGTIDPFGKLVAATPPWLISLIVHFSSMILMGIAVMGAHRVVAQKDSPVEVDLSQNDDNEIYAEQLGEQLDDPSVKMSSDGLEPSNDAAAALASSDLPEVDEPLVGPPVLDPTSDGSLAVGTVATPAIGLEFSGREEGTKKALLKAYGGTALTEEAVKEGLAWLARQQRSRGFWNLAGPYHDGARQENEEAATAMALLAFQGAGYTPNGSKNDGLTKIVTRGWHWLLRSQQPDGHFYGNLVGETHQLYTQALCTIALCELYGMTHDEQYHDAAQRAVDFCVKSQAPEGGWRYVPGTDSDLSVTGWFSMALQSARMAGIEVPSATYANIGKFLDSVAREEGARYAYHVQDGATLPITAEGLLCRQYLGWSHDDARLRSGVNYLLANLPSWNKRNVYYWYYATQVCHHMEGKDWQKWNAVMRQLLPENQEKRGAERGSWNPAGDRWGDAGGRLYVTCLSLYTLEVYYRHLPIYREKLFDR